MDVQLEPVEEVVDVGAQIAAVAPDVDAVFAVVQFKEGGLRMFHTRTISVAQTVLMLEAAKTEVLLRMLGTHGDAHSTRNTDS
jgi:hypothetical protein